MRAQMDFFINRKPAWELEVHTIDYADEKLFNIKKNAWEIVEYGNMSLIDNLLVSSVT